MQSNKVNKSFFINLINKIKSWKVCDILYFADSFGSMDHLEVKRLSSIPKNIGRKILDFCT